MNEIETPKIVVEDEVPAVLAEETVVVVEQPTVVTVDRPRKVYAGMWGPLEIGAVAAGVLCVMLAGVIYFFWVVPSERELARNRSEADRLEAEVISAKKKYGEITDTETQVARIVSSIDDFETRFLPITTTGQSALYQRINGLISAYGLVNTTGPDYSPLEPADQATQQEGEDDRGRDKYRSLYPGVYVSMTVEGPYQNLRRFIREIETGREFIIVSTVELAPTESETKRESRPNVIEVGPSGQANTARPMQPGMMPQPGYAQQPVQQTRPRPQGKTQGELVSLHIELAAYFRRPSNPNPAAMQ